MVKDLTIALFALATGFTLSGIIANVYQLVTGKHEKLAETANLALMSFFSALVSEITNAVEILINSELGTVASDSAGRAGGLALNVTWSWYPKSRPTWKKTR